MKNYSLRFCISQNSSKKEFYVILNTILNFGSVEGASLFHLMQLILLPGKSCALKVVDVRSECKWSQKIYYMRLGGSHQNGNQTSCDILLFSMFGSTQNPFLMFIKRLIHEYRTQKGFWIVHLTRKYRNPLSI